MKNNAIKGVYKNIYIQARMPFETDTKLPQSSDMTEWINLLKPVIKNYKITNLNKLRGELQSETAAYYLIKPFITVSTKELQKGGKVIYQELDASCISKLEVQLELNLTGIITNLIDGFNSTENSHNEEVLFNYILKVYEQPLEFFSKFPILSKLLSEACVNWVKNTKTVLKRFVSDFSEISQLCNTQDSAESRNSIMRQIKNIEVGLSDPHEHAQTVWIFTIVNNKKIVYKPKNIDTELYFNQFVDWVNTLNINDEKLHTLKAVLKESYGWVQYVDNQKECNSKTEIGMYYKRLGSLSAILYILRGTDYHHDNLVSSANIPYFIDHEMLCYPIYKEANPEISESNNNDIQDNIYESVLNTRVFPVNEKRIKGAAKDISAVGFYKEGEGNPHLPRLNNQCKRYHMYMDSIIEGFKQTYVEISNNKEYLLNSPDSPLLKLKDVHIRFNSRATFAYLSIIKFCVMPNALLNGKAFCDYIHSLRVSYPSIFSHGLPVDMRLDELKILTRLDVPRFTVKADAIALDDFVGGEYAAIFDISGYQLVTNRVAMLGDNDMNKQIDYITKSLTEHID